jgi:hypothetical protein
VTFDQLICGTSPKAKLNITVFFSSFSSQLHHTLNTHGTSQRMWKLLTTTSRTPNKSFGAQYTSLLCGNVVSPVVKEKKDPHTPLSFHSFLSPPIIRKNHIFQYNQVPFVQQRTFYKRIKFGLKIKIKRLQNIMKHGRLTEKFFPR